MIGELNGSHLGCYGGGRGGKDTGRLGYVADPTYKGPGIKVAEVFPRGPLDQPEATIKPGQFILAIDGKEVDNTEKVYALLEDKAGERVKLLVNDTASKEGAKELSAKPITGGALGGLWYDLWADGNRENAKKLSGGRVYYIHMSGMNAGTLQHLDEELRGPAQHYDAVIIDVRFNGGGYTHDSVLELLTRKVHGWSAVRGIPLRTSPGGQFDGPMCCLINENSFSDAEIFPNGFREKKLGKLIGISTAGGVIGTWDTTLVNGAGFRVPVNGWYTAQGIDLENYGVPPDIEVPYPYEAYRDGKDPQIEAAVKELLQELQEKGPAKPPELPGHPAGPIK
jgi:tricorn protease